MKRYSGANAISTKTTAFVIVTLGVLVALMAVIQFRSSLNRVEQIEDEQAIEHSERVVRQFENALADMGGVNSDWAWWDATYEFIQDGNEGYSDENLYAEGLALLGVNLMAYLEGNGGVVYEAWYTDEGEQPVPADLVTFGQPGNFFGDFSQDPEAAPAGLVSADGQVFLVTSRAILHSDQTGPPAGVLLMGHTVDDAFVADLGDLVNLELVVDLCTPESCVGGSTGPAIAKTSDSVSTETVLTAIDGTPVLSATVTEPRTLNRESVAGIQRVLLILIGVGLVAMVVTIAGLRRLIIAPLERLGSTVAEVARNNDPSLRSSVDRSDEIGRLAGGLNVMLARLENSQQQLEGARQQVEIASEAKSRFLSRVSHELRTPINGVLAYAQLLQLDELDDEAGESVDQIITAARHITALVDEFLDIARIEAGAIPLSIESVDATSLAIEVISMTRPLAEAEATTIRLATEDHHDVLADPVRLRQVILNLVSNAIKYGVSEMPIDIEVRALGTQVAIDVRDHGAGIPADQIGRLFVPFDRLEADGSGKQGTGIGLSVSKQLVELMGGSIDVSSVDTRGSTFTITLPAPTTKAEVAHTETDDARRSQVDEPVLS